MISSLAVLSVSFFAANRLACTDPSEFYVITNDAPGEFSKPVDQKYVYDDKEGAGKALRLDAGTWAMLASLETSFLERNFFELWRMPRVNGSTTNANAQFTMDYLRGYGYGANEPKWRIVSNETSRILTGTAAHTNLASRAIPNLRKNAFLQFAYDFRATNSNGTDICSLEDSDPPTREYYSYDLIKEKDSIPAIHFVNFDNLDEYLNASNAASFLVMPSTLANSNTLWKSHTRRNIYYYENTALLQFIDAMSYCAESHSNCPYRVAEENPIGVHPLSDIEYMSRYCSSNGFSDAIQDLYTTTNKSRMSYNTINAASWISGLHDCWYEPLPYGDVSGVSNVVWMAIGSMDIEFKGFHGVFKEYGEWKAIVDNGTKGRIDVIMDREASGIASGRSGIAGCNDLGCSCSGANGGIHWSIPLDTSYLLGWTGGVEGVFRVTVDGYDEESSTWKLRLRKNDSSYETTASLHPGIVALDDKPVFDASAGITGYVMGLTCHDLIPVELSVTNPPHFFPLWMQEKDMVSQPCDVVYAGNVIDTTEYREPGDMEHIEYDDPSEQEVYGTFEGKPASSYRDDTNVLGRIAYEFNEFGRERIKTHYGIDEADAEKITQKIMSQIYDAMTNNIDFLTCTAPSPPGEFEIDTGMGYTLSMSSRISGVSAGGTVLYPGVSINDVLDLGYDDYWVEWGWSYGYFVPISFTNMRRIER